MLGGFGSVPDAQLLLSWDLGQFKGRIGAFLKFPSCGNLPHILRLQGLPFLFLWLQYCLVWFCILLFCFAFGVSATSLLQLRPIGAALRARAAFPGPLTRKTEFLSLKFAPCPKCPVARRSCPCSWHKDKRGGNNQESHPIRVIFQVWLFTLHLICCC